MAMAFQLPEKASGAFHHLVDGAAELPCDDEISIK
jgi:hypothetical protein